MAGGCERTKEYPELFHLSLFYGMILLEAPLDTFRHFLSKSSMYADLSQKFKRMHINILHRNVVFFIALSDRVFAFQLLRSDTILEAKMHFLSKEKSSLLSISCKPIKFSLDFVVDQKCECSHLAPSLLKSSSKLFQNIVAHRKGYSVFVGLNVFS